ncbi:MAG TPA: hypothetical protein VE999_06535 [Gemmataceae bacterium]|nr:hypothetical protein [Gemmataceae bacterium]
MFRVDWLEVALDELTTLWMQADATQRQAITAASHAIDQRLSSDPHNEGESRPGGRRITFVAPLAVRFQVEPDGQTVTVLHVSMFRRRAR